MARQPSNPGVGSEGLALAEGLRLAVGNFVRAVRGRTGTRTTARSDTLGLLDREGSMSTAALARRRRVKHQSMRLVIADLERGGLVARAADPDDRRGQLVAITTDGVADLNHERQARALCIAAALQDHLSSRERETLAAAAALLDRLAKAIAG